MSRHAVVVVGGGPTGLMLAGELALAGVDVAIVERRAAHDLVGSRAGGMNPRTIEVLDQRGIADRFLAQGVTGQTGHYAGIFFDVSELPTRHNYGLALLQHRVERVLADWIGEFGVRIYRGCEVSGFAQDEDGVDVHLADGGSLRAQYLVGCDGGRSIVRKAAGIDFPGWAPSMSCLVADVQMAQAPPWGLHRDPAPFHSFFDFGEGAVRVMVTESAIRSGDDPTLSELSAALTAIRGTDYGMHSPTWVSRFTDVTRQAASYRDRRVLLAGDAAHVHFPIGGQGLNTGVQDAVNLGWKLAQVVNGVSPETLLDTYQAERHPVGARMLHHTLAQTALNGPGPRVDALRDTVAELLTMRQPREKIAAMMCALDVHYALTGSHPLVGRRMPDLDLSTADGPIRTFTLLHTARPVLLNLGEPGSVDVTAWGGRIRLCDAKYSGVWELPVIGRSAAPSAVLIRPDGYVAWVGEGTQAGLVDAVTAWFGPPEAA